VDNIVDKMIDHYVGSNVSISGFGLVSLGSKQDINIHGVFTIIIDLLDMLKSILPTVIEDMKFAKKEVGSVASTLKSIFHVFKEKGPKLFDEVAEEYKAIGGRTTLLSSS
jgi:hypothetical protein